MVYNIIAFALIVGSIVLLIVLFLKKMPQVALIDVEHIPEERDEERKQRIMEQRLARQLRMLSHRVRAFLEPVERFFKHLWGRMLDRIHALEERSHQQRKRLLRRDATKTQDHVADLMRQGEALMQEGKYEEAEQAFIEVVSLDRRHVGAYTSLAELYTATRQYDHAREVWAYIERLVGRNEQVLTNMGLVHAAEGKHEQAWEDFREALALAPQHPRLLDLFIEECILIGRKDEAREALRVLRSVNPENHKIEDFEKRILDL